MIATPLIKLIQKCRMQHFCTTLLISLDPHLHDIVYIVSTCILKCEITFKYIFANHVCHTVHQWISWNSIQCYVDDSELSQGLFGMVQYHLVYTKLNSCTIWCLLQTIKNINTQMMKLYIFRVFKCISSEKDTEIRQKRTE